MVQNLRAYFILSGITFKYIGCVQGKIDFSCMLQRLWLISTKILGDLSLVTMIKHEQKIERKFSGVAKEWHSVVKGRQLPPPWLRACSIPSQDRLKCECDFRRRFCVRLVILRCNITNYFNRYSYVLLKK